MLRLLPLLRLGLFLFRRPLSLDCRAPSPVFALAEVESNAHWISKHAQAEKSQFWMPTRSANDILHSLFPFRLQGALKQLICSAEFSPSLRRQQE